MSTGGSEAFLQHVSASSQLPSHSPAVGQVVGFHLCHCPCPRAEARGTAWRKQRRMGRLEALRWDCTAGGGADTAETEGTVPAVPLVAGGGGDADACADSADGNGEAEEITAPAVPSICSGTTHAAAGCGKEGGGSGGKGAGCNGGTPTVACSAVEVPGGETKLSAAKTPLPLLTMKKEEAAGGETGGQMAEDAL